MSQARGGALLAFVVLSLTGSPASAEAPWSVDPRHPVLRAPAEPAPPGPAVERPTSILDLAALAALWAYSNILSPVDGQTCAFRPSCAGYARQAVARHGWLLGTVLAAEGDAYRAITEYRRFAHLHPESPRAAGALLQVGELYGSAGRWTAAAAAYDRVTEAHPGTPEGVQAALRSGEALYHGGRRTEARARLKRFVERHGSSGGAYAPHSAKLLEELTRVGERAHRSPTPPASSPACSPGRAIPMPRAPGMGSWRWSSTGPSRTGASNLGRLAITPQRSSWGYSSSASTQATSLVP